MSSERGRVIVSAGRWHYKLFRLSYWLYGFSIPPRQVSCFWYAFCVVISVPYAVALGLLTSLYYVMILDVCAFGAFVGLGWKFPFDREIPSLGRRKPIPLPVIMGLVHSILALSLFFILPTEEWRRGESGIVVRGGHFYVSFVAALYVLLPLVMAFYASVFMIARKCLRVVVVYLKKKRKDWCAVITFVDAGLD